MIEGFFGQVGITDRNLMEDQTIGGGIDQVTQSWIGIDSRAVEFVLQGVDIRLVDLLDMEPQFR